METLIKLENVYKTYRLGEIETPALNGVSLDKKKG